MWYNGTVEKMHPETNEFQVLYDGEDEACNYALLDDIRNGDVILMESMNSWLFKIYKLLYDHGIIVFTKIQLL